jgi:hypothetical protein
VSRALSAAVAAALVLSLFGASGVLAVDPAPTVTTLTVSPVIGSVIVPGGDILLSAQLDSAGGGGTMDFFDVTTGTPVAVGTAAVPDEPTPIAEITIQAPDVGAHTYRANYLGTTEWAASSDEAVVTVEKVASELTFTRSPATLESHSKVSLSWDAFGPDTGFALEGTVTVTNLTTGVTLASGGPNGSALVTLKHVGTNELEASYSGDDHYLAISESRTVTVTPDLVHARRLDVQYATFYPVVDFYRDTDKISGVRDERISVRILIYNPNGHLVRSASIARGTGSYGWKWNGKNGSGVLQPAGKYKVVQKLTDKYSNHLKSTDYITLSRKSLHYSTVSLQKLGSHPTAAGGIGVGKVRLLDDGSARLTGVSNGSFGWAAVGYQFSMPSATVYKNMKLAVYGSGNQSTYGPTTLAAQNFDACAYDADADWNDDCFAHFKSLSSSTGWTSASLSQRHRHNRVVRGSVSTFSSAIVWKMRLTVTIGVLQ